MTSPSDPAVSAHYSLPGSYRARAVIGLAGCSIFAVVFLVLVALGREPAGFAIALVVWSIFFGVNGYRSLTRTCYRLDLEDDRVRWYTALRHGSIRLDELRAMRPSRFTSQLEILETESGQDRPVIVAKGFSDFAHAVQAAAPHVTVKVGLAGRLTERTRF